jgi:hypothetical protein
MTRLKPEAEDSDGCRVVVVRDRARSTAGSGIVG